MSTKRLEHVRTKLGDCVRCGLNKNRTHLVFGRGSPKADLMFIGESPGAREDEQGVPFVGRSGKLLSQWLEIIGLSEEEIYIGNIIKCKPPKNRNPSPGEISRCLSFLHLQIMVIKPRVLVSLGKVAGGVLSGRPWASLKALRATQSLEYHCEETNMRAPLVSTYHPSYVLRREGGFKKNGEANGLVLSDLRRAVELTTYLVDGSRESRQRETLS